MVNAASLGIVPFLVCISEQIYVRLLAHRTSIMQKTPSVTLAPAGADINKTSPLLRDLVIASAEELDETEPVAEGIGHESKLAPLVRRDGLF